MENEVWIAKTSWLCQKNVTKAYETMVVYVTKSADAAKLSEGQCFNLDGEPAFARRFKLRREPMQSFRRLSFGQKALSYTKSRFSAGVLSQATATISAKQRKLDVQYAASPQNCSAASVVLSIQLMLLKTLQVLQLNMQKQREVRHSVMNETGLEEYAAPLISEPHVFEMDEKARTRIMRHQSWMAGGAKHTLDAQICRV